MPKKRQVTEEYLSWLEELPEEMRDSVRDQFMRSAAADKIANLHAGMTEAQQRAAEMEGDANYGRQMRDWASQHEDILRVLPEVGPLLRRHRPEEIAAALENRAAAAVSEAGAIEDAVETGELSWEDGQRRIRALDKEYRRIGGTMDTLDKFYKEEWPTVVQGAQKNFETLDKRITESNGVILDTIAEAVDYAIEKRRPIRPLIQAIRERKASKLEDAMAQVYGEDDQEALLEAERARAREEAKADIEKQYSEREGAEGSISGDSYPSPVFQRARTRQRHEQNQFSKDDAAIREQTMRVLSTGKV